MSDRRGLELFADDAQGWRAGVGARAPSYDRLLEAAFAITSDPADAAERAARERLEAAWRERRFTAAYDRPLLLMAALRAEALRVGPAHPLHAAIAGEPPRPEAASRQALAVALADAPARLHVDLATRWVQTNEPSRAVAWLWPAALAGAGAGGRPLALADLGCSAGLNLVAGGLPPLWTDPAGAPLPLAADARLVARRGFDARPLDVGRADDVLWLRACIWPGDGARLERLARALAAFEEARREGQAPVVETADAAAIPARLEAMAAELPAGTLLLAYQTVVRDYLPADERAAHARRMAAWVAAPAREARLFVELEAAPDAWAAASAPNPTPMAITALVRDAGAARAFELARCSYHPSLVVPNLDAVAEFARATR
jgi:hypothetical protein